MKASSLSGNPLHGGLNAEHRGKSLLDALQNCGTSLLIIADHIGTSIALGEQGDLDAAHEFRKNQSGEK